MGFLELAADCYSVRTFSDRPIEPEKMEKILKRPARFTGLMQSRF